VASTDPLLANIPVELFCALDSYYLAMEKGFRNAYSLGLLPRPRGNGGSCSASRAVTVEHSDSTAVAAAVAAPITSARV